jgi:hypothetical protein
MGKEMKIKFYLFIFMELVYCFLLLRILQFTVKE